MAAAEDLRFEYAAQIRDELRDLRRELREIHASEGRSEARSRDATDDPESARAPSADVA